jgi:PST family polysaccharide transporter
MKLLKTSLINSYAVVIKMICLLGINKVLAIYVGPSGYAFVGQFQIFVQSVTMLGTAGVVNGVVKYTSEHHDNPEIQKDYWKSATAMSLISTCVLSIIILVFSEFFSELLFQSKEYASVFQYLSISLIFFSFNSILLAILNGMRQVVVYVKATIIGNITSLIVVCFLVYKYSLMGALVGLAIFQSISFFATLFLCYRFEWFDFRSFIGLGSHNSTISLLKYSLMALTSAIVVPLSQLFIRGDLIAQFGRVNAGYWEAIWRLSGSYLMFITGVLTFYFLPKFSELDSSKELKREILEGYKLLLPFMFISMAGVYLFQDLILWILFSDEFKPALKLLPIQLLGDLFKVSSWLLGFIMLAKGLTKVYVLSEIIFSSIFVCLSFLLTRLIGLEGVVYAYTINFCIYGFFLYIVIWKNYLGKYNDNN